MRSAAPALLGALAMLLLVAGADARLEHPEARVFLAAAFNLTAADLDRIDRGEILARTLPAGDRREVATLGAMRVAITPEFYVERLNDIANFKQHESVLQIGTFGTPPDARDMDEFTFDEADVRHLRRCRVGNCGVQLSAGAIERFRDDVDWSRPDAPQQANALMRQVVVEHVAEYLEAGTAALGEYADRPEPMSLEREFLSLAESGAGGWRRFPALRDHLVDFPGGRALGATDLVYWSKEKVARRGVLTVTHLAIAPTTGDSPADYAVASKQIYGTHYFDASLGLTVLVRDRSSSSPAMYLAYMNRSRIDMFEGVFGGLTRAVVTSRARATVSDHLTRLQGTLEHHFAGAPRR